MSRLRFALLISTCVGVAHAQPAPPSGGGGKYSLGPNASGGGVTIPSASPRQILLSPTTAGGAPTLGGPLANGRAPLTYAATLSPDFSQALSLSLTMTGNVTQINCPANLTLGIPGNMLVLKQDGVGGRTVLGWPSCFHPQGASGSFSPSLLTAANTHYDITLTSDDGVSADVLVSGPFAN